MTSENELPENRAGLSTGKNADDYFRRLLRAITDNATLALFVTDERRHCVFMNPAAEALTGYTLGELENEPLHNFIHHTRPDGSSYPLEECPIDRVFPQNDREQGEEVFVHKNGSFYPVAFTASPIRENGKIVGTIVEVRGVGEQKQAEEILRKSEERYRAVVDVSPQAVWLGRADGYITFCNRHWIEYTGMSLAETQGSGWTNAIRPDWREAVAEAWRKAPETGNWEIEIPFRRAADGEYRWHLARGLAIRDEKGAIARWVGVAIDIHERQIVAVERERLFLENERLLTEAREASRLKDDFLATVSHELRTPLNAISGWSSLLLSKKMDDASARKAIETINRNARAQAQIIEDILDISRIISGNLRLDVRLLNPAEVIETAVESARPAADAKGIRLQMLLDPNAAPVSGDPDRLQQAVWNLISNAVKFTAKGGRIQVRLERVNSHVEISISDTGEGISADFLPHVFERFRQNDSSTSRLHGGLGLGLSIVRQIVELHGGIISVVSPGEAQGSTFTVSLPISIVHSRAFAEKDGRVHPKADDRGAAANAFDCPPQLDGLRVLIVDDEPDARELLTTILEQCWARVLTVASAAEMLEKIDEFDPHVLVSDIGLPEVDGYDLIRKVRARERKANAKRVPAVALTAYARVDDRMKALAAGFQMHVPKPVEPAELAAVIASLTGWEIEQKSG